MFIQTQATGAADVIRFLPGREVLGSGQRSFASYEEAAVASPLAARVIACEGVEAVTLGADFVEVRKASGIDWGQLKPAVLGALMEHFIAGAPVLLETSGDAEPEMDEATAEIVADVKELIATRVVPAVEQDGGHVAFHSYREGVVYLEMSGGVHQMLGAIANMLRHYIPEITAVRDARDAAPKPGLQTPEGQAVQRILDEQVNPAVASHGGYIQLIDVQEGTAYIELTGGCQGCGMADVTLKQGVERAILEQVPAIVAVRDVTDHASGENPYFRPGAK